MILQRKWLMSVITIILVFSVMPAAWGQAYAETEAENLAKGLDYEVLQPAPGDRIAQSYSLTDGEYGSLDFNDPAWQGFLRDSSRTITFDLGEEKSISQIKTHFMQDTQYGIYFPRSVSLTVSTNGVDWADLANLSSQIPSWQTGETALTQFYTWDGQEDGLPEEKPDVDKVYARYVNITFTTDVWVFIDEIEIWGFDGKVTGAKALPPTSPNEPDPDLGYLQPGESTAGIRDLVLLYNGWYESGVGDWTKEDIKPYISYVDENEQPIDWFFDGVLYLGLASPEGRDFHSDTNPTNLKDWQWYLNKTFAENGDMAQLNEAAQEVAATLDQPDHKVQVVLAIPYPSHNQSDFGDVDGDGQSENFNFEEVGHEQAYKNKQKAVEWYIDEVGDRWSQGYYEHLELSGLYWIRETVNLDSSYDRELIRYASDLVHRGDLTFFWIPHVGSFQFYDWDQLGFDATALQPNHFFDNTDISRIEDAANQARHYGMGIELEFDNRMLTDDSFRQRYIDYLNGGIKHGYMQNTFNAYYQGGDALLQSARSEDPDKRILYDWMYQFVNEAYKETATDSDSIKKHVDMFAEQGEFTDDRVAHALKLHLTAVDHFEKQGKAHKVLKHMASFKLLLDHRKETGSISWLAYNILRADADTVIAQWE